METKTPSWLESLIKTPEMERLDMEEALILEVSERLIEAFEKRGLSYTDIADRIGCSKANVSQALSGSRNMTLRTAAAMSWAAQFRIEVTMRDLEKSEHVGKSTSWNAGPRYSWPHSPSVSVTDDGEDDEDEVDGDGGLLAA